MNFMPFEILQGGYMFVRLIGIYFWELIFLGSFSLV
jgi:hypothetical protein